MSLAGLGSLYAGRARVGFTIFGINAALYGTRKVLSNVAGVEVPPPLLVVALVLCVVDVFFALREVRRYDRAANRILAREGMPLRRFPIVWALALLIPFIMFLGGFVAYFLLLK